MGTASPDILDTEYGRTLTALYRMVRADRTTSADELRREARRLGITDPWSIEMAVTVVSLAAIDMEIGEQGKGEGG